MNCSAFSKTLAIFALLPLAAFAQHNPTEKKHVEYTGTLLSQNLSAMETDGPGIFTIKTENKQTLTVMLSSGESLCDTSAIQIPQIKVGDTVHVSAMQSSDGSIWVCETGTYIK